ncbi:MAG TPA: hypothetical protein VK923_15055 [Euzebyales bacterium]|nr:hypothetical protein [Euzebyales bacterium]
MRTRVAKVAPDVYCAGPWGRTQTNVYLVRSGALGMTIAATSDPSCSTTRLAIGPAEVGEHVILLGGVAPSHYSIMGFLLQAAELVEATAPAIARSMVAEGVDVAVLVPV